MVDILENTLAKKIIAVKIKHKIGQRKLGLFIGKTEMTVRRMERGAKRRDYFVEGLLDQLLKSEHLPPATVFPWRLHD